MRKSSSPAASCSSWAELPPPTQIRCKKWGAKFCQLPKNLETVSVKCVAWLQVDLWISTSDQF
jgi:hypothetical protein